MDLASTPPAAVDDGCKEAAAPPPLPPLRWPGPVVGWWRDDVDETVTVLQPRVAKQWHRLQGTRWVEPRLYRGA